MILNPRIKALLLVALLAPLAEKVHAQQMAVQSAGEVGHAYSCEDRLQISTFTPREALGHWQLNPDVEQKESGSILQPVISMPPIPLGFFCKFEDEIGRKLGFGLDFGTEVKR